MLETQSRWRQRGSALLITLFVTLAGAAMLGLTVDAMSLVWVRSNAQTTANLAAASVALELERNPAAPKPFLVETARATAAWNGYRHGMDSVAVHLDDTAGLTSVLVERDAQVFFLRMIRPQPVAIRARASVGAAARKAGI